jgi:hypothetical protein
MWQVAAKEAVEERVRRLRLAAVEEDMLGDFIRLVDYMTVESLVLIALNTNRELLESLQQSRKQGLLLTAVSFGEGAMDFMPRSDEVHHVRAAHYISWNVCSLSALR